MTAFSAIVIKSGWRHQTFVDEKQPWLGTMELRLSESFRTLAAAHAVADEAQQLLAASLPAGTRITRSFDANKPPAEPPIILYLYSGDDAALARVNEDLQARLRDIPGVRELSDPLQNGISERVFRVDHAGARRYGLAPADVTRLMHLAVTGREVGKLNIAGEQVPVYVSGRDGRQRRSSVLSHITRSTGDPLPLARLGRFEQHSAPPVVQRRNDIRYVVLEGEIDATVTDRVQIQGAIEAVLQELQLPAGSRVIQGGDFADIAESLDSMARAAVLALGLCYLLLTLVCRSYVQPMVLLCCIPPALVGVFWGLWLSGDTLSILGVAGIIGLIGIVLNDALVWVDFYNRQCDAGLASYDAALATVKRRFRPIALTTVTTVLALLPAAIFGAGVATDIARITIFGLSSASVSLLFFLPVMMLAYDNVVNLVRHDVLSGNRVRLQQLWTR